MIERKSDKGTPRSNLHAILEDDEDGQEKENEEEEEEGSNQEDQACPLARDQAPARR